MPTVRSEIGPYRRPNTAPSCKLVLMLVLVLVRKLTDGVLPPNPRSGHLGIGLAGTRSSTSRTMLNMGYGKRVTHWVHLDELGTPQGRNAQFVLPYPVLIVRSSQSCRARSDMLQNVEMTNSGFSSESWLKFGALPFEHEHEHEQGKRRAISQQPLARRLNVEAYSPRN
jgi:hypothetical protein